MLWVRLGTSQDVPIPQVNPEEGFSPNTPSRPHEIREYNLSVSLDTTISCPDIFL